MVVSLPGDTGRACRLGDPVRSGMAAQPAGSSVCIRLLGFIAFLGVTGASMVAYEIDRTLGPLIRRTTLSEPSIVDGIAFPAGTRLQFDKYRQVESGIFPSPTLIQGLLLTGRFEVEHNAFANPRIWAGVLARETEIEGVPCAGGEFQRPDWVSPEILKCRLARDFDFLGFPLASGSLIELYPAYGPKRLERGTLRTSAILFDVEWPAGTAITSETDAATLLHAPGYRLFSPSLCTAGKCDRAQGR
jgi:hypothetical protein